MTQFKLWHLFLAFVALFGLVDIALATTGGGTADTGLPDVSIVELIFKAIAGFFKTWGGYILAALAVLAGIGLLAKFF